MLIDDYLPRYDVRERHRLAVHASPRATYAALRSADLVSAPIVRALLLLRALPGGLRRGRAGLATLQRNGDAPVTLRTFESRGFRVIAERPPEELVIGLEGRFWRLEGDLCTPASDAFLTSAPSDGTARAVWNFTVRPAGSGDSELATETRVLCADAAARRRFLPYWLVVRAGSGIIRRAMLRAIRREAEAAARSTTHRQVQRSTSP